MKAIIIDDEVKAREVLAFHLNEYTKEVEIVESFTNINDAANAIPNLDFDIVFLDINMPHGTGFDLIEQNILENKLIIFVTAHENYAIKAFKVNAFDYLLKPIDPEELMRIISKANRHLNLNNLNDSIIFKSGYDMVKLNTDNITHISSQGNYTTIFASDGQSFMISKNLKKVEALYFQNAPFIRVHQSHIVNITNIVKFNNTLLVLQNDVTIPISKQGLKYLKQKMLNSNFN